MKKVYVIRIISLEYGGLAGKHILKQVSHIVPNNISSVFGMSSIIIFSAYENKLIPDQPFVNVG